MNINLRQDFLVYITYKDYGHWSKINKVKRTELQLFEFSFNIYCHLLL